MDTKTRPDPVARACELWEEIAAAANEIERTRRIPETLLERLHDSRLFRMLLPRSAGGDETEPGVYVAAIEELARLDASTAWIAFVKNSSALIAAYLEPAANRAIFADPHSTVAWGPPNASQARAVDGGYLLTGRWDFASGCRQARWMGAHCQVLEASGTPRLNRFGQPTIRTLLFPIEQATLLDVWQTIGLRGTASDLPTPSAKCSCRKPSAPPAKTPRCAASAVRCMPSPCRASMPPASPPWALATRAGRCWPNSSSLPRARRRADWHGWPRQRGSAGRGRTRGGPARLGARLFDRDARNDLRAGRRGDADRGGRPRPRPARLQQRDPGRRRGGGLRLQGRRRRRDLPRQPVRAPLSRHAHALAADPVARRRLRKRSRQILLRRIAPTRFFKATPTRRPNAPSRLRPAPIVHASHRSEAVRRRSRPTEHSLPATADPR